MEAVIVPINLNMYDTVILLPAHPASFTHNVSLVCKVFISASPRMQWYCKLVMKIAFWIHTLAEWETASPRTVLGQEL